MEKNTQQTKIKLLAISYHALPGVMYPVAAAAPTNAPRVKAPRPLPRTAWTAAETAVLTTPLVCPEK